MCLRTTELWELESKILGRGKLLGGEIQTFSSHCGHCLIQGMGWESGLSLGCQLLLEYKTSLRDWGTHEGLVCAQLCATRNVLKPLRLLCSWNFPGKNTGAGCHFLLRDLPHPGEEPASLKSPALAGGFFTTRTTWGVTDLEMWKFLNRWPSSL